MKEILLFIGCVMFDLWNILKKKMEKKPRTVFFKERDVFFINMWKNIWDEQDGKWEKFLRPVIVLKKFNNSLFWWIPLTTQTKENKYYYSLFLYKRDQSAILSQLRMFDSKRLYTKIAVVSKDDFQNIKEKIKTLL